MKQLITNPYILDQSFDTKELVEDKHGRITVKARIMKVGQLKYLTATGKEVYANINIDDLEKAKSTIINKPVTIGHPPVMLNSDNVKDYQEGTSADNARIEEIDGEQWLVNDLVLQTTKAKNTVKEGKLGISAGYFRDAIPKGLNIVDFKNIDGNHIAIGSPSPRAKGAGISLDSSESDFGQIIDLDKQQPKKGVGIMKRKLNAVKDQGFSMDEASIDHADDAGTIAAFDLMETREKTILIQGKDEIERQKTSFDDEKELMTKEVSELKGAKTVLEEENKAMKEAQEKMISMDDVEKTISELADVRTVAETVFGKDEKIPEFTNPIDGIKAVVTKKHPGVSFDDDSQYRGAFAVIKGNPKDNEEMRKSKEALKKAKENGESMDDNKGKFNSWKELKAAKQSKEA